MFKDSLLSTGEDVQGGEESKTHTHVGKSDVKQEVVRERPRCAWKAVGRGRKRDAGKGPLI